MLRNIELTIGWSSSTKDEPRKNTIYIEVDIPPIDKHSLMTQIRYYIDPLQSIITDETLCAVSPDMWRLSLDTGAMAIGHGLIIREISRALTESPQCFLTHANFICANTTVKGNLYRNKPRVHPRPSPIFDLCVSSKDVAITADAIHMLHQWVTSINNNNNNKDISNTSSFIAPSLSAVDSTITSSEEYILSYNCPYYPCYAGEFVKFIQSILPYQKSDRQRMYVDISLSSTANRYVVSRVFVVDSDEMKRYYHQPCTMWPKSSAIGLSIGLHSAQAERHPLQANYHRLSQPHDRLRRSHHEVDEAGSNNLK